MDTVVAGTLVGGSYACVGMAVVLLYRLTGVLNFALLATAATGLFATLSLHERGLPLAVAAAVGVVVGAAASTLQGVVDLRWFSDRSTTERAALTIPVLLGVVAGLQRVVGNRPRVAPDLLGGAGIGVLGVQVAFTTIVMMATVLAVAAAATAFLHRRRLGLQLRAAATRPGTARLLGIDVTRIRLWVWAFVGALTTFTLILVAPSRTASVDVVSLLIVPGLSVALIAGLTSLLGAVLGGLGIGLATTVAGATPSLSPYVDVLPFVVVMVLLVWTQRNVRFADAR